MSSIDTVRRATSIAWNTGLPMTGMIEGTRMTNLARATKIWACIIGQVEKNSKALAR